MPLIKLLSLSMILIFQQIHGSIFNATINDDRVLSGWRVLIINAAKAIPLTFVKAPETINNQLLSISYNPQQLNSSHPGADRANSVAQFETVFSSLRSWIIGPVIALIPNTTSSCPVSPCSTALECKITYTCWFQALRWSCPECTSWNPTEIAEDFVSCIFDRLPSRKDRSVLPSGNCIIQLYNGEQNELQRRGCGKPDHWGLDKETWLDARTDENIQTFIEGGPDTSGVFFPGLPEGKSLIAGLLEIFQDGTLGFQCSLLSCPHITDFSCGSIGTAFTDNGSPLFRSRWAFFTLNAFFNIHNYLQAQWDAIGRARSNAGLDVFAIQDFWKKPDQESSLVNVFTGIAMMFAVLAILVPEAGAVYAGTASGLVAGANTFYERSLSSTDDKYPFVQAQQNITRLLESIWDKVDIAMSSLFDGLFQGFPLPGGLTLPNLMRNGAWAIAPNLEKAGIAAKDLMQAEVRSRVINAVWQIPNYNKMWVLFVDLGDINNDTTQCRHNDDGPQATKHCADGGVYYAYNWDFEEGTDDNGFVTYPWGLPNSLRALEIDPRDITYASAELYKQAKRNHSDPFNYNPQAMAEDYLLSHDLSNIRKMAGKLPGTWTLPVCHASHWGAKWNFNDATLTSKSQGTHPPCICGPQGEETEAWVKAAGLQNFAAYWDRCHKSMKCTDYSWPDEVESVSYGFKQPITKADRCICHTVDCRYGGH